MAAENRLWGQKRIQAELARLGFQVSARTGASSAAIIGNVVTYAINFGALVQDTCRHAVVTPLRESREVGTASSVTFSGKTAPALAILETA
jgi:hypothetical protein